MSTDQTPQVPVVATTTLPSTTPAAAVTNQTSNPVKKTVSKYAPKRNEYQKLVDRHLIQKLLCENKAEHEITTALNTRPGIGYTLSKSTVHGDIEIINAYWRARTVATRTEWVAASLRNLDRLEAEAWAAYFRSTQNAETQRVEANAGDLPKAGDAPEVKQKKLRDAAQKIIKTSEGQSGEPALLRIILDLQEKRIKLLGHEAAQKIDDVSKPRQQPITLDEGAKLAAEFLRRHAMRNARTIVEVTDGQDGNRIAGHN